MCGILEKKIYPLGGPVPAARFGGLDKGGQGSEKFTMFCIHMWIPHEIPNSEYFKYTHVE